MAQSFDLQNLTLTGEAHVQVADRIEHAPTGLGQVPIAIFAASPNGVLVVWRHTSQSSQSVLQWIDRSGRKLGVVGEAADYSNPALSPDDTKLAVGIRDSKTRTRDIWIFDLLRGTKTRLAFDPNDDLDSIWSPDGRRIAFYTPTARAKENIYWKPADGSGSEELLLGGKEAQENMEDWSRDGKFLMYNYQLSPANIYLYVLPLAGDRKPVPYLKTEFRTSQGQFSPNGQWVAYRSRLESGRAEIYVQGVLARSRRSRAAEWQISVDGGEIPRWRRDSKELFFHYERRKLYFAVDVKSDDLLSSFQAGIPKPLFATPAVVTTTGGRQPIRGHPRRPALPGPRPGREDKPARP